MAPRLPARRPRDRAKRLFFAVVGLVALPVVAVAAFNLAVDPYGWYGTPAIAGFNALKPHLRAFQRRTYPDRIAAGGFETILLGTSRAGGGLTADHPAFAGRAFNAAVAGANAHDLLRLFQQAHAKGPLRRVVIGADFFSFNAFYQKSDGFDEDWFAVDERGNPVPAWLRRTRLVARDAVAAFTWDALIDSFETIRAQVRVPHDAESPDAAGHPAPGRGVAAVEEQLRQIRYQEKSFLQEFWFPAPENGYSFTYPGTRRTTLDAFETIARTCREDGIALYVFFSPIHARLSFAMNAAGLWPRYETWKRRMVEIVDRYAPPSRAGDGGGAWDFSGPHPITMEPIPVPGPDARGMTWFAETSHYRPTVGALMIDRMFGRPRPDPRADGFGRAVGPGTLEAALADARKGFAEWALRHPAEVDEIATVAQAHNRCCRTW